MLEPVPWLIDGGAIHSAEVSRLLGFIAAGGRSGVVNATDFAVTQEATPGSSLLVAPGAYSVRNTYPSQTSQAYLGRAPSSTLVPVTQTGSTKRSDLLVIRIDDPQYGGTNPADVTVGPYARFELISNVGAGATEVPSSINYPCVLLARIDIPAMTQTMEDSFIVPLRQLLNPLAKRELRTYAMVSDDTETLNGATSDGEYWPNSGGEYYMDIPEWATQMQVRVDFGSVFQPPGNAWGYVWMEYGPVEGVHNRVYKSQKFRFDSPNVSNNSRANFLVADTLNIPAVMRGTRQLFITKGRIDGGQSGAHPVLDHASAIVMDIMFNQIPV